MKRVHRKLHLAIWVLLAPILAAVIWGSLEVRPADPINAQLPANLLQEAE